MERRECISFNTCELSRVYPKSFSRHLTLLDCERSPVYAPADACPNPNSTTTIKCVFWGNELEASMATNYGEMRKDFRVLIAGELVQPGRRRRISERGY